MVDATFVEISSDESSDEVSECSEYVPDGDYPDFQTISSSDDDDSDDGEYQSDECDGEVEEESVEDEEENGVETEEAKYDKVIKLLAKGGDLNALKLEEIKAYLRKHGLRITGTKSICIQRIHEHIKIKDGGGQKLYPRSSFVINCRGDVCTGDIVLFTQKVYEKYDLASRGGAQTPIGKRTIAGRVVKESYGAAKQQHTFTVEILWSTGVNPLPPLYPLLIKGRNIYRLRTYRQPWPNEAERAAVLAEKHARGAEARSVRASAKAKCGSKGHKRSQDSHRFEPPSKRHKLEKSGSHRTAWEPASKKAKSSKTQRPINEKFLKKNNGRSNTLAATVRHMAVSEAPMTINNPSQNSNIGNESVKPKFGREYNNFHGDGFHIRQNEVATRNQIMHQYLAYREGQGLHKFHPEVSYPFGSDNKRLPMDPYINTSSIWMPQNPVRSDYFLPSNQRNPRAECTNRSGVIPSPQVHIHWPHLTVPPHIPVGGSTMQVPNSKPAGSFTCSFSSCHDMAARDCVNSACCQCCRRIGRRCKRHKIS